MEQKFRTISTRASAAATATATVEEAQATVQHRSACLTQARACEDTAGGGLSGIDFVQILPVLKNSLL